MTIIEKRKIQKRSSLLLKTLYRRKSLSWKMDYLRKKQVFHHLGTGVHFYSNIPSDAFLVSIGNNVIIAAGCEFITHDIFYHVLNLDYAHLGKFYPHFKPIVIEDNVCIGGFSKIMPRVKIGRHSIVAGGSVVTKDVPEGVIVGGNPAKVIGTVEALATKRANGDVPHFTVADDAATVAETLLKRFEEQRKQ